MTMTAIEPSFYYDVSDELEVAKFPEDFADWLMDEGREQDAKEFLVRWKRFEESRPDREITLDAAADLAQQYADVIEINEETRNPAAKSYAEAFRLLRDLESADEPDPDDDPMTWDREAAAVNHFLADSMPAPVDMDEHEFDDVTVYVDEDEGIVHMIANTITQLAQAGYVDGAKEFALNLKFLLQRNPTDSEMFGLIWSYVDVRPTPRREAIAMLQEDSL